MTSKVAASLLLATVSACATVQTLTADVDYGFVDENGVGWVTLDGEVTVTLRFTGACTPTTIPDLDRSSLYECELVGFAWESIADLPELHHAIVLDADTRATTRVGNSLTGRTKPGFGQRVVR